MTFMTVAQIAALYALRKAAPVLEVEPVLRGWWRVCAPDGRCWFVDEAGATHRHDNDERAVA